MAMDHGTWNLVDAAKLDPSHSSLPTKQRRNLYESVTKRFRINKDGSLEGDLTDNKFATRVYPMSIWHRRLVFIMFNLLVIFYIAPIPLLFTLTWYFWSTAHWIPMLLTICIGLFLEFHPVSLWREPFQGAWYYCQYNYFSYRLVYHSSVKDYINHQLLNHDGYKSLIYFGVPHAIFPYAIQLFPPLAKDVLNKPAVGSMADVLHYLPLIRQLFLWNGAISASKKSIVNALNKGHNVGLVVDGIAGMFANNDENENILLKNRKGLAKLVLQTGISIVPCYGFGSTDLFEPYFDSAGIMKTLSRKLKMSIIAFAGKYWTLAPDRVPLYFVMGPVIVNPNKGEPIENPSQQQIDEFHAKILKHLKTLFDSHKGFYGWQNKQINFI